MGLRLVCVHLVFILITLLLTQLKKVVGQDKVSVKVYQIKTVQGQVVHMQARAVLVYLTIKLGNVQH